MRTLLVLLTLLIAGCATDPAPIKTVDRIVNVPVPTPCKITSPVKPEMPADGLKKEDALEVKVKKTLADIERRKSYEKDLEGAIKGCQ